MKCICAALVIAIEISAASAQPASAPRLRAQQSGSTGQQPQRTEIVTYENWTVTCASSGRNGEPRTCSATLQAVQQNTNRLVFAWSITRDSAGKLISNLQTPTGVLLTPGVEMKFGDAGTKPVPYVSCEPNRCRASTAMDDAFVKLATATDRVDAVVQAVNGTRLQFTLQTNGLPQALAALRR